MLLLRALGLAVLLAMPAEAETRPAAPPPRVDARAECLKACAGAPKDATGQHLLACLNRCEVKSSQAAQPDAGTR